MNPYPENIEFEIDRPSVMRYWRLQALTGCLVPALILSMAISVRTVVDRFPYVGNDPFSAALSIGLSLMAGGLVAVVIGCVLYMLIFHFPIKRAAQNLRLVVEGPYLRLTTGSLFKRDRRIHFRAISDYSTHDGPLLRWLQMKTLSFCVVSGGPTTSTMVPGVIAADKVRDQLCEIDAAREV